VARVPADRLRKFALSATLRGDDRQAQILDARISLDTSRIDGGVTIALRARPAFGASVSIDHLNLDAYLPAGPAPAAGARPAAEAIPTGPPAPLSRGARSE